MRIENAGPGGTGPTTVLNRSMDFRAVHHAVCARPSFVQGTEILYRPHLPFASCVYLLVSKQIIHRHSRLVHLKFGQEIEGPLPLVSPARKRKLALGPRHLHSQAHVRYDADRTRTRC